MTDISEHVKSALVDKALKDAEQDQSFEAKCARAVEKVDRQMKPRIDALRLIGPLMAIISPKHAPLLRRGHSDFVIGNCKFCNPDPKMYKCPLCDWETPDKWRMQSHTGLKPKWCQDRAAKKVRNWSRHA